jgi:CPA2 family monovalent cation:H+ antiporter-2
MALIDPLLATIVIFALVILVIAAALRYFKQPYVVVYILAGILLGPFGLGLVKDTSLLTTLGNIGIMVLLFFIGLEISLKNLLSNWRVAMVGTLIQILGSIGFAWVFGLFFAWPFERSILIGFVISLSSTALVLKILEGSKELQTKVGQDVISILLTQDLALIPMIIILGFLGGTRPAPIQVYSQIFGGILLIAFAAWIVAKKQFELPFRHLLRDHEMQVFAALLFCFGLAFLTGIFGLSPALGAFIGGIVVSTAKETQWVHSNLNAFRVFFVAMFFVSIGLLFDVSFIQENWIVIGILIVSVMLLNTVLNAAILHSLKRTWKESLLAGTLLAPIGEFSYLLVAIGLQNKIIGVFEYQLTIALISFSLLLCPLWVEFMRDVTGTKTVKEEQTRLSSFSK